MAVLADDAKEAVLEHAAAQVIVEFRADILRQRAVFRRKAGEEVRIVRLYQRIQLRSGA